MSRAVSEEPGDHGIIELKVKNRIRMERSYQQVQMQEKKKSLYNLKDINFLNGKVKVIGWNLNWKRRREYHREAYMF